MADDNLVEIWKRRKSERYLDRQGVSPVRHQSGIGDVTEGPIVGALVSVFKQLEEMGVKRNDATS
jgi:hypothetical protein